MMGRFIFFFIICFLLFMCIPQYVWNVDLKFKLVFCLGLAIGDSIGEYIKRRIKK